MLVTMPKMPNLQIGGMTDAEKIPLWLAEDLLTLLNEAREETIESMRKASKPPRGVRG